MIYTVANQKGGAGKTTSVVSLAALWAEDGENTLVIDLDPQGSSSKWLRGSERAMGAFLQGKIDIGEAVEGTEHEHLDLAGADRSLATVESYKASKILSRLQELLEAAEDTYAHILIDPPPSTGSLVMTALMAADQVLVPVQASQSAIDGLTDTLHLTRQVGAPIAGIYACRVDQRTVNDREVPNLLRENLSEAMDTHIRETVQVREAEADRTPLPIYAPEATATTDYQSLISEVDHG